MSLKTLKQVLSERSGVFSDSLSMALWRSHTVCESIQSLHTAYGTTDYILGVDGLSESVWTTPQVVMLDLPRRRRSQRTSALLQVFTF